MRVGEVYLDLCWSLIIDKEIDKMRHGPKEELTGDAYVFQCRPTSGNWHHSVPIEQALQVIHSAQAQCSGLEKRARYIMSHKSGKIEVIGKTSKHIFMKSHLVASPDDQNSMLIYKSNSKARWLEDYHQRLTDMVPKMTWLF